MKLLILLLVLLSTLSFGQNLPLVVDNSKWFPPVRDQKNLGDCNHFSLIYYLKSAIWNKQFNRNPKLEVNQFNHNFVWNQNINPVYKHARQPEAFYFMKNQGCATVADFPINEQSDQIKPSLTVREKALTYKSKRVFQGAFFGDGDGNKEVGQHITDLKDSLAQGKCFSLDIPIFGYITQMTDEHNVYNCYPGIKRDSVWVYHTFTIVGYNDTILTANGRGAFQVIDSDSSLAHGHYYLDYNWFYFATWYSYRYYFLEEDFSNQPTIALNFNVSNLISGVDLVNYKNVFVDTIINYSNKKFDFVNQYEYLCNQNQIQVVSVNNKKVKMRSKVIIKPNNNLDGNYELISDVSDLSSVSDFKSVSVVIFDPIFVNFIGADGQSFYSYSRESKLLINKAYLNFSGTSNQIISDVKDLPDTTIVTKDFYSNVAGFNLKPQRNNVYVKSCTSVLKRKLITFSTENSAPVITNPGTLVTYTNKTFAYQFKATDKNNNKINFSLLNSLPEAELSGDGNLIFKSAKVGTYNFTVIASNGLSSDRLLVTVRVDFDTDATSVIEPDYSISAYPNPVVNNLNIEFLMKQAGLVNLSLYDLQGRQVDIVAQGRYEAGKNKIEYDASNLRSGTYICRFITDNCNQIIKVIKK